MRTTTLASSGASDSAISRPFQRLRRPHEEIRERITQRDVDRSDGDSDDERAQEDLEIERTREQKAIVLERWLGGELLRLGLEEAR